MTRRSIFFTGLLLSAGFLWLASRNVNLDQLLDTIRQTRWTVLFSMLVAMGLFLVVKTFRWRLLLAPIRKTHYRHLLPAVVAGTATNAVVPHSGEFLRAVLISRQTGIASGALLASVAVERLFDFATVLILVVVAVYAQGMLSDHLLLAGYTVATLAAICLIAVAAFLLWTDRFIALAIKVSAILPSRFQALIETQMRHGADGLRAIHRSGNLLPVLTVSLGQWLIIAICIYLSFLGASIVVPFSGAIVVLVLTIGGLLLPTAPGYVGTMQLCFTIGLAGHGVAATDAVAASLLYNFIVTVPPLLATIPALRCLGYRFDQFLATLSGAQPRAEND